MSRRRSRNKQGSVQIIPLGGVGEIGKNMFVIKYENDILVIDSGLAFPEDEMLGIDIVIPDISYLIENKENVRGIVLSHGHEDHIGALPYLLNELDVPIWGTKLTLGMVKAKLAEYPLDNEPQLKEINSDDKIQISSSLEIEFFRTNHSIPDSVGVIINTPAGLVVYTGDYKFDQTPVNSLITEYSKIAALAERNVLVMLTDCTNAGVPGYTCSEKEVGESIDDIFRLAKGRILVATFASNIHRIQQVVNSAVKYNRKISITGRSIFNSTNIAMELGYLDIPKDSLVEVDKLGNYPPDKVALLTTGSQGEPMSALSRISNSEHRNIKLMPGDTVIISASAIPGNEKMVFRTVDNLFKRGADVLFHQNSNVHVSGHGSEEEIKMMLNMVKPQYIIPVHGEYRHMIQFIKIAEKVGIERENVFILENGSVMEFNEKSAKKLKNATAGNVLIDGLGVGDVGNVVLRDRRVLSEDGIVVVVVTVEDEMLVSGPEIITRGFVYVRESEDLLEEARRFLTDSINNKEKKKKGKDRNYLRSDIRDQMSRFFWEKTGRRPMILPVILDNISE